MENASPVPTIKKIIQSNSEETTKHAMIAWINKRTE